MPKAKAPDGLYTGPSFTVEPTEDGGFTIMMSAPDKDGNVTPLCFFPEGFRIEDVGLANRVKMAIECAFDPTQGLKGGGPWFASYIAEGERMQREHMAREQKLQAKIAHLTKANNEQHDTFNAEVKALAKLAGVQPWTHKPTLPLAS